MANLNDDLEAPLFSGNMEVPSSTDVTPSIDLELRDLEFFAGRKAVCGGSMDQEEEEKRRILCGVNALFSPGKVTALMGPSGAGKTTLLNVLSGHANDYGYIKGEILANGSPPPNDFRRLCALVPQDDVLLPGLTVIQTLRYTAALKLKLPAALREQRVEEIMHYLGLTGCRDVLVGDVDLRGISGGQRKRTSIALELITNPPVMFLDEPTSGLDSSMAEDVAKLLSALADGRGMDEQPGGTVSSDSSDKEAGRASINGSLNGTPVVSSATALVKRTIICTIHQPSYRIFRGFDEVILLSQGRIAYSGSPKNLVPHLDNAGLACPEFENPSDHSMRLLQDDESVRKLFEAYEKDRAASQAATALSTQDANSRPTNAVAPMSSAVVNRRPSWMWQMWVLWQRFCTDFLRDPKKFVQNLAVRTVIGIVLGTVWLNQAGNEQANIFPVQGALFACCLNGTMDTVFQTALLVPKIRALIRREYRNGAYAVLPLQMSLVVCHAVFQNINIVCLSIPVYFMVGLRGSFFIFVGCLSMLIWIGTTIGIAVGSAADTFQDAQAMVTPTLIPLILFSGYLIPFDQIPEYFKWLYELSFFQFAITILQINQFNGLEFTDCDIDTNELIMVNNGTCLAEGCYTEIIQLIESDDLPEGVTCYQDGSDFLEANNIDANSMGRKFAYLAIYIAVAFFVGHFALRRALKAT